VVPSKNSQLSSCPFLRRRATVPNTLTSARLHFGTDCGADTPMTALHWDRPVVDERRTGSHGNKQHNHAGRKLPSESHGHGAGGALQLHDGLGTWSLSTFLFFSASCVALVPHAEGVRDNATVDFVWTLTLVYLCADRRVHLCHRPVGTYWVAQIEAVHATPPSDLLGCPRITDRPFPAFAHVRILGQLPRAHTHVTGRYRCQ
jgi:hypothetical protein